MVKKKIDKRQFITQAEFARRVGIHPVTVGQGVKSGRFKLYKIDGQHLLRYREAKKIFLLTTNNSRKTQVRKSNGKKSVADDLLSSPEIPHDLHDARIQLEKYKAMQARLTYEENTKQVIKFADVKKTWMDIATNLQKSILAIADRIGPLAAAEPDNHSCTLLIRTELKRSLQGTVDKYTEKLEDV